MNAPSPIECLPVELLYDIHMMCLNEYLPIVSKHIYAVFRGTSVFHRSNYIFRRYIEFIAHEDAMQAHSWTRKHCKTISGLVTHALLYPLSNQRGILESVLQLSQNTESHSQIFTIPPTAVPGKIKGRRRPVPQYTFEHGRTDRVLLPKRLFKDLTPCKDPAGYSIIDEPLLYIKYLYNLRYPLPRGSSLDPNTLPFIRFNPNAHDGYALVHAVHANHRPLIRFLLRKGAKPNCKDALAVRIAVRKKNLALVRMLVEREEEDSEEEEYKEEGPIILGDQKQSTNSATVGSPTSVKGKKPGSKKSPVGVKRRKLEDRMAVSTDLLKSAVHIDARDIVQFFLEKGARPNMSTMLNLTALDLSARGLKPRRLSS